MKRNIQEPDLRQDKDVIREAIPLVTVPGKWEDLLAGPVRETLEEILPQFLIGQRWFGGKARPVRTVRLGDWAVLPGNSSLVFLVLLEVAFRDGSTDCYFFPMAVVKVPAAAAMVHSLRGRVLIRLSGPGGIRLLVDALAVETACAALLAAIAERGELTTRAGLIRAAPTAAYASLRGPADTPLKVDPGPATSSNSLVLFGDRLLLKVFRRLDDGINPELEIGRYLTEKTGFTAIPRTAGWLEYQRAQTEPITLAILEHLVANQGDGWRHAMDELKCNFDRVCDHGLGATNGFFGSDGVADRTTGRQAASGTHAGPSVIELQGHGWTELAGTDPPPDVREAIGDYLHEAGILGRRTAQLHLALAQNMDDPAFAPEPLTAEDLSFLAAEACEQADHALALLQENLQRLPVALLPQACHLLNESPELLDRLGRLPASRIGAAKIRCHGDYHLGQVLRVEDDFVILDFEGEPAHTIARRRAKQSPLKDVAGMMRSFSYAAYAGLFAFCNGPEEQEKLVPWAELWHRWVGAAFLKEYQATAGPVPFLPAEPELFDALLRFFMLDKAFYELTYELNNRPDWVAIPLQAIADCGLQFPD
jgi:maltose alpha-D-glucosyltransferase/alpha-amylase